MKKFINTAERAAQDSLAGFAMAHPHQVTVHNLTEGPTFITRNDVPVAGKVAVVSGGGTGHDPLHNGFVGPGMLDAAVPGPTFTSPTPDQIFEAIRAVDSGCGVLLIVKNYTGDVLNFEVAAELAEMEGITTSTVLVADDVAVENSTHTVGRRGVAGTLLVEKIAGAAAERGDDLAAVTAIAQRVSDNIRSMGVALEGSIVAAIGKPGIELDHDEAEIGIGIHGEPGRRRVPMTTAAEITAMLVEPVLEDMPLSSDDDVFLLVNGMGATPLGELYIVFGEAKPLIEATGATVKRSLVGSYVTSLNMQGVSVTTLKLDNEMINLWDAPVHTPALTW
ncbi:MAG: dihydroxyacetone kinase subunit DhaK [Cellulomonadaceae bacterium]|nr:dihydroxyacetone kinase subunit DhaK [Cellulomonadaceae bacterium]